MNVTYNLFYCVRVILDMVENWDGARLATTYHVSLHLSAWCYFVEWDSDHYMSKKEMDIEIPKRKLMRNSHRQAMWHPGLSNCQEPTSSGVYPLGIFVTGFQPWHLYCCLIDRVETGLACRYELSLCAALTWMPFCANYQVYILLAQSHTPVDTFYPIDVISSA